MKHFYLYILLLCFIIIGVSSFTHYYKYYVLREAFDNNNKSDKTYILLGDSIIKNNSYVKNGKGIDDILNEKTNGNTHCYAKDDSTIVDIYSQLDSIPSDLNKRSTTIFLSVGGNDILNNYADKEVSVKDKKVLDPIFNAYKNLIKSIQTKMNESTLVLLDIYYPKNIKLAQYKPILEEWNRLIADFASTNNLQVINISNILIESTDFTLNIEPSETGGEKIANNILLY
jgi:hypothetical protein